MTSGLFSYTSEQAEVVKEIRKRLKGEVKKTNLIVSGRGGVGKTRMICELICDLIGEGHTVAVAAMTGKATGVLRSKIESAFLARGERIPISERLKIDTIHSITKKSFVISSSRSGEVTFGQKWRDPADFNYEVLIIDELSMVPHTVQKWWAKTSSLIIGLGDGCQLKPVETDYIKEEETLHKDLEMEETKHIHGYGIRVLREMSHLELKTVMRSTGDITKLCNELRDFTMSNSDIISVFKSWSRRSSDISYSTAKSDLPQGDEWQILTYTNREASRINQNLMIGLTYPDVEDKIVILDNINQLNIYNGEVYTLIEFLTKIREYNEDENNSPLIIVGKWQGKVPSILSKNPIERAFAENMSFGLSIADKVALENLENISCVLEEIGGKAKEDLERTIEDSKKKGLSNEYLVSQVLRQAEKEYPDLYDKIFGVSVPPPRVQFVSFNAGYAMTVHKAQGSEFEKVCYYLENFDKPLLYTACSRAKKELKIINTTKYR